MNDRFDRMQGHVPKVKIIRDKLELETRTKPSTDKKLNEQRGDFFYLLYKAWDAITYDQYPVDSTEERNVATFLSYYYQHTKDPVIPLSPLQTRMVDALAEVAGIPRDKGKKVVIPDHERVRNRRKWFSEQAEREAARNKARERQ